MNHITRLELFREIRKSRKRYLSILLIVALGVAFYTGVRSSGPDMEKTVDTYYDDSKVMDLRIISDWGFDNDDVEAVSKLDGVESAAGYRSLDIVCPLGDKRYNLTVMESTPGMNEFNLIEGRLPTRPGECLIDPKVKDYGDGVEVGDTITLEAGRSDEDLTDTLSDTELVVVGVGTCPWYFSYDRGTCTTGDGDSDGYLLVSSDTFVTDYYMQLFVRCADADDLNCFAKAYEKKIEEFENTIRASEYAICKNRYEKTDSQLTLIIDTIDGQITEGEEQLALAKAELEENEAMLQESLETLEAGQKEYDEGLAAYEAGLSEYEEGKQEAENAEQEITAGNVSLDEAEEELQTANTKIELGNAALTAANAACSAAKTQCDTYEQILSNLKDQLADAKDKLEGSDYDNELTQGLVSVLQNQIEGNELLLDRARDTLADAEAQVTAYETQIAEAEAQAQAAEAVIAANRTALNDGQRELGESEEQLTEAKETLAAAKEKLDSAKEELDAGRAAYEEGKEQLEAGWDTYEQEQEKATAELAEAKELLADTKAQQEQLTVPEWSYYTRESLQAYVEYSNDAERIDRIGRIFPVIFFLVAALVALTTMTRMVDEQRLQIGTMKAIGYSDGTVAIRFLFYALSAAGIGCLLGIAVGEAGLPRIILFTYGMMYSGIPKFYYAFNWDHVLLATIAALGCIAAATLGACYREFQSMPAGLMRPHTPKSGKKIFFERLTFLWKHLGFSLKATIRNLCRYKKRLIMTVVGIGGCMGILLTSFGLRDSIYAIAQFQFTQLQHYDGTISLDMSENRDTEAIRTELLEEFPYISQVMALQETSVEVGDGTTAKATYMMVPDHYEEFTDYIMMRDRSSKETYTFPEHGVAISEKLALSLDKKVGDTVWITYGDQRKEAEIVCIFENYIYHYMYMSKETYQELFGEEPNYSTYLINLTESTEENRDELAAKVLADDRFASISFMAGMSRAVDDMLSNLSLIIIVLIVSGGLLAFIVLFNLNNINITERRRELATLEVLGFYTRETAMYVYRENVVLTLLGIGFGLFFGTWLHRIVVETVEVDVMMFGRSISTASYCYSALLTLLFAVIINGMMLISIRKIDMVESLKSVE